MRLRSYDRYSEPAKRVEDLQNLHNRIDKFLETFIEGDGDSLAPVSSEDHEEFYGLVKQLIALKWNVDADGDLPLNFDIVNRNQGRLVSVFFPYEPNQEQLAGKTPDEVDDLIDNYVVEASRSIASLMTSAQTEQRNVEHLFSRRRSARQEKKARTAVLETFIEAINGRTDETNFNADRDHALQLLRGSGAMFFQDNEARKRINDAMAAKYPNALKAAIAEVIEAMKPFTHDESNEFNSLVREPRLVYYYTFGEHFSKDPALSARSQELAAAGKAIRDAARVAKNKN